MLLENGRRISAFASLLPFMRGTALTPDPSIKNRQAPCGACRFLALDLIVDTMRSVSILHLLLANSATLAFSRGNDRSNFFKQFRGVDHYQSKFLTYSCNTLIEEIWV